MRRWWRSLPVGTKSILVGAHAFWLHPFFVAVAWWRLYGFALVRCPSSGVRTSLLDPRLWICFAVHDLGYLGQPNMDGPEGEMHPFLGSEIVSVFGDPWCRFSLYHSRFLARRANVNPSLLCHADKAAIWLTPAWIYLPMARLSGELAEYRSRATRPDNSKGWDQAGSLRLTDRQWHAQVRSWARDYALAHRQGGPDTWTRTEAAEP